MSQSRRDFLTPASPATTSLGKGNQDAGQTKSRPLLVSTWFFGKKANDRALSVMRGGGTSIDGIEQGIRVNEAESSDGSVGLRGGPNAAGFAQLDACIMAGPGHRAGSVAAVEGIVHPISAARRVMEKTRHVMLVGQGARWFALDQGIESVDVAPNGPKKKAWLAKSKAERLETNKRQGHDTIALVSLDSNGDIHGGCSTSGAGGKLPGRVGDSPIIGGGLYVDNEVGAAGATGIGENVMRYCASFLVVEFMRMGFTPTEACRSVIHRLAAIDPQGYDLSISFVALDRHGRYGAASTSGFSWSVTSPDSSKVYKCPRIERRG